MEYKVVRFDQNVLSFLPQKQEPFEIIGRLIPQYTGSEWRLSEEIFKLTEEEKYSDDAFDPMDYVNNKSKSAFLAMYNGECVGSIRVCKRWNGNAFIEDLIVCRSHRRIGIGTMLMDAAVIWGQENGLYGVSLETQDYNLPACRFYLKYGFKLGGIDRFLYTDEAYRRQTALYFYLLPAN